MKLMKSDYGIQGVEYSSDVQTSDVSPILVISVVISSLVAVGGCCLYCFYPRLRKRSLADDEEECTNSTNDEQISINSKRNSQVQPERVRKMSSWNKFTSLFQTSSATDELNYRLQSNESMRRAYNADSISISEKPAMGDVRRTYVQPHTANGNARTNGASAPVRKKSSFLPEGFKFPFDPWLLSDDSNSPPQGAHNLGRLQFSVSYSMDTETLIVKIIKATDLPAMDMSGYSDPFVKCCLLPDRKRKLETKIKRKCLNPVWQETLHFEGLEYGKIKKRVLLMQVLDWDRFSRNDPIGDVCVPLDDCNLMDDQPQWEYLTPSKGSNKRGELLISLCYHPIEGTIDIGIKQAKNLKPMDIGGTSDPYVKIWQIAGGRKVEKKKTITVKNCLNPNFEETFTFSLPMNCLRETQLEITVMDRDRIGRNEVIGKIYLGTKSNGLEKRHWKEMLAKMRQPVEQWHILKV